MHFGIQDDTMHSLFLEHLIDNSDNELTIIISKSITRNPTIEENRIAANGNETLIGVLNSSMVLEPNPNEVYKIYFESYIMYQGRNESYAYNDDDDIATGIGLILFEKSKLLDYAKEIINEDLALAVYKRTKLKHYGIYTLNNIVDIITFCEPTIEKTTLCISRNTISS